MGIKMGKFDYMEFESLCAKKGTYPKLEEKQETGEKLQENTLIKASFIKYIRGGTKFIN